MSDLSPEDRKRVHEFAEGIAQADDATLISGLANGLRYAADAAAEQEIGRAHV